MIPCYRSTEGEWPGDEENTAWPGARQKQDGTRREETGNHGYLCYDNSLHDFGEW